MGEAGGLETTLRPTVLLLIGASGHGYPDSGPVHSVKGLVYNLAGEFAFKVVAHHRTFGAESPEPGQPRWHRKGAVDFCFLSGGRTSPGALAALLRETPYDVLALNSVFDREFTMPVLFLRRLGLIPRTSTLLSPRGEFANGALALKALRKQGYLAVAKQLGLFSDIWLHATSSMEAEDIRCQLPCSRGVFLAPSIRRLHDLPIATQATAVINTVRLVYFGRVARVKNLHFALKVLSRIKKTRVTFDIYGPVREPGYWQECQQIIEVLPENVTVSYRGAIPNNQVPATVASHDLFFLPTPGENFGHAILESLASGVPALISDRTPWTDLERREAGWSLPLDRPDLFVEAIERFAALGEEKRAHLRRGARRAAEAMVIESDAVARNREMLETLVRQELPSSRGTSRDDVLRVPAPLSRTQVS